MPPGIPRFRAARVGRVKVAAEAARRFLFARHFLAPARSVGGGLDGVLEVFRTLGSIQFDPIAVAGRNHDLVLHVWEGFFPPAKRRWGWYVLPIGFGDRFVGRIEPRIDRNRARVEVLNLWWEDGFAPQRADGFVDAMRDALRAYLRFADAEGLDWAPHLATDQRLFRT